ncbi:hypothetical protein FRC12_016526 [Ceratobasidium sp. 428]|nr:hypothetical protein FRC12_016526 [Ceratobasidium sp. 428]
MHWVASLSRAVAELEEVVGQLWRARHFACALQAEDEEIENQVIVLEDECRKLKTANKTEDIGVRHILIQSDKTR